MASWDPTSPSQRDDDYDHHRRHRLPSSIVGGAGQAPLTMESRMGADEALILRPVSWSTGPTVHRESVVGSTDRLVHGGESMQRVRKMSELFGFGFGVRKGSAGEKGKERVGGGNWGKLEESKKQVEGKKEVKKRKSSRRLSEMVGFGDGAGDASEKSGWLKRLSSFTWKKAKSPTRKDSVWPTTAEGDAQDKEVDCIVPQNTATDGVSASTYPYPSQADQHAPWRRSHDADTVSDHWTPTHSACHSETNLLLNQQNDTRELLGFWPQLERCSTRSQWQEIQRASSNLTLAHKAITPPQTVSPSTELTKIHQRAARSFERVQRAYEEGRFNHDKIAKTFDDDRKSSPEAEAMARSDYLGVVAARQAGMDEAFAKAAQRHQHKVNTDRGTCCDAYRPKKSSVPDRSTREASGEEHGNRSVGSEMAHLAGVIGSSMQHANPFM